MNQLKNLCNHIPKWFSGIPSIILKYYNQTWQKYLSRVQESRTRLVAQPVVKLIQYFGITKGPENFWELQALSRKTHPLCRFLKVQPLLLGRCQTGTEIISELLLEQCGIRMTFVVATRCTDPNHHSSFKYSYVSRISKSLDKTPVYSFSKTRKHLKLISYLTSDLDNIQFKINL